MALILLAFLTANFMLAKTLQGQGLDGDVNNKPELIESINKRLSAFPGIIFNYTQPAEDAVDEALTGLKSALAVKVYGNDLNFFRTRRSRSRTFWRRCPDSPNSLSCASWANRACWWMSTATRLRAMALTSRM